MKARNEKYSDVVKQQLKDQQLLLYGKIGLPVVVCRSAIWLGFSVFVANGFWICLNTMGIEEETDRTVFIRNLDTKVTEELLFELFLQVLLSRPIHKTRNCG